MKHIQWWVILVIVLASAAKAQDVCEPETEVTLDLKGKALSDAVLAIASQSRCVIGFPAPIAKLEGAGVYLDSVPLRRALPVLAAAYGVCFKRHEAIAIVEPC